MGKLGQLCLNWKVMVGLAVVGVGIWVLAPQFIGAALPLLLLAVCPLSMLIMVFAMRKGMSSGECAPQSAPATIADATGMTRDERLAQLTARLASIQAQQEATSRELAALESVGAAPNAAAPEAASPTARQSSE